MHPNRVATPWEGYESAEQTYQNCPKDKILPTKLRVFICHKNPNNELCSVNTEVVRAKLRFLEQRKLRGNLIEVYKTLLGLELQQRAAFPLLRHSVT